MIKNLNIKSKYELIAELRPMHISYIEIKEYSKDAVLKDFKQPRQKAARRYLILIEVK